VTSPKSIAIALATTVTCAPSCGGDFDPASRVTELRVLGVRADAPYAAPGQSVHLEALAFDAQGRALTWGWGLCINPASPSAPGCVASLETSTLVIQRSLSSFDFTLPADVITSLPPAAAAHASVGAIVVACPGELSQAGGSLPFRCVDAASGQHLGTDAYVVGVKRIFARSVDRNENPVIERVRWDGSDWSAEDVKEVAACDASGNDYGECTANTQHVITVDVPAASTETGIDSFGASFEEQVIVQYYATEGIFEHDVRLASESSTGWTARRESAGSTVKMWFVVRDDRGGVTWEERQVRVTGQ
jgi:hypothetical protein